MTNRRLLTVVLAVLTLLVSVPGFAQTTKADEAQIATRAQLRRLLDKSGPKINVTFKQVASAPFNFAGNLRTGLTNSDEFEIVIIVTKASTIEFRVYPHYKGGYINVDKAADANGLMKKLLQLSNTNFLFWGADSSGDVFTGYSFTLESGFPTAAISVVLSSIPNQDQFVGQLKPFVDGKPAP